MDLIFALIYNWLHRHVTKFGLDVAERLTGQVTALCVVLVTIWVLIRGYRLVTGTSREPAMVLVSHMIKVSMIVFAARTVAVGGSEIYDFLNTTIPLEINYVLSGDNDEDLVSQIDKNLVLISAATSLIDSVQVPGGDLALAEAKNRTTWMATLGIAAPAMTAAAMLLLYQIAMAMLLGMAPFFVLCLIFDQTKELFRRWLMYLLSTIFSMAMLCVVLTWVLSLTLRVATAIWAVDTLSRMTGVDAVGFNTLALQQGGVGLLMTVLIISTPPMAAMLFNGTMGQFSPFAQVNGGSMGGGYQGAPYAAQGTQANGASPPPTATSASSGRLNSTNGLNNPTVNPVRTSPGADQTKSAPSGGGRYT